MDSSKTNVVFPDDLAFEGLDIMDLAKKAGRMSLDDARDALGRASLFLARMSHEVCPTVPKADWATVKGFMNGVDKAARMFDARCARLGDAC